MRAALLLIAGGVLCRAAATGAPDEACPSGGDSGCVAPASGKDDFQCVKWRQTGLCSPKGPRERQDDKSCDEEIPIGSSGYCQCGAGKNKLRAREVTCDHRPFRCATECLQIRRYMCLGWRQTGGCSSSGPREPALDRSCDDTVNPTMSGYCECGDGRLVRKPGCQPGEFDEPFKCRDECLREPDLYEELDLDSGASEKAIKQAFRKLSLKYHPDKTRSDPVLTARFTAIREAYEIISDQEQRAFYDAAGLKMLYEAKRGQIEKGPVSRVEIPVTLQEFYNGAETKRTIRRTVICRGCAERFTDRCKKCQVECAPELEVRNQQMGPMIVQRQVQVPSRQKCRHAHVELDVAIEPGTAAGDEITFKGVGEQHPKKIPGDVVLTLRATEHEIFRRAGTDLHTDVPISLREALLGFERSLTHMDGRLIAFSVHGVTKPLSVLRVRGEGMPSRGDPTQRGDLYVRFQFTMPSDGEQWLKENCASLPA